jgi:hypothetical protein
MAIPGSEVEYGQNSLQAAKDKVPLRKGLLENRPFQIVISRDFCLDYPTCSTSPNPMVARIAFSMMSKPQ